MELRKYDQIDEIVYYEKLDNGLKVYLIPKKTYNKTYALFATKYGSIDNRFVPYGKEEYEIMPLGIAHFLEHKLFETKEGIDAANILTNLGAQANAYTNYTTTAYLFSTTDKVFEALNVLLDFVQEPYFTDENVAREQGIIEQELKMYLDIPSEQLRLGLLKNMFKEHYINQDIGGTVESIKEITKEKLYTVYETFYHPSNMVLVVVGNFDVNECIKTIRNNQQNKQFHPITNIKREYLCEDNQVVNSYGEVKMDILMPKVAVGLKLPYEGLSGEELLKQELLLKILLEDVFGTTSNNYQEMLDKELITRSFSTNIFVEQTAGFLMISTDTLKDDEFANYVKEKLLSLNSIKMSKNNFNRYKKVILGNFIKSLNYLEYIANSFIYYHFKEVDIFKVLDIIEKLTYNDLKLLEKYFVKKAISIFKVLPKNIVKQ
ncbi:MAG TPA: pitrilysin family protein [Bacilli bacterium]|nr:pitrilysin family protein [Bacilli bacterium]HPT89524.1 pitrilysin family protein [Bacilli bacterium]